MQHPISHERYTYIEGGGRVGKGVVHTKHEDGLKSVSRQTPARRHQIVPGTQTTEIREKCGSERSDCGVGEKKHKCPFRLFQILSMVFEVVFQK